MAICTYCLIAIVEHEMKIGRNIYEVMRIIGSSLLVKGDMKDLFFPVEDEPAPITNCQLTFYFEFD